jgi:transcriptional regulator with XRE-family HTH domain
MSKSERKSMTNVLKKAVRDSGLTRYRLAVDTGVPATSIMRFMRGETSLRLDKADLLADYLGLALVKKRKAK